MNIVRFTAALITSILIISCDTGNHIPGVFSGEGPSHVEMRQVNGRYRLIVNGEEFFVKGAGCEFGPCYQVAAHGGNSIRTWRTENGQRSAMEVLDEAYQHGLMVLMGLDIGSERHGFDYNETEAVARQLEELREEIRMLKDHPALLGWGIGNELNLHYTNLKVWNAVNDIAKMIREEDGNHVITTMLAGIGKKEVEYISENCPDLDFLSVQMYGDIINLGKRLEQAGYTGPYLVTEWGATGHWEVSSTEWGSPIEQTSSEKADAITERYKKAILDDDARCMGSFVFLWGQKQERTPSWYGLFTESGEKTEAINIMEYLWTGRKPEHSAARLTDINIRGKGGRYDNVFLESDTQYKLEITVDHPEKEMLTVRAEIMPEPVELSVGGDFEKRPKSIGSLVLSANIQEINFNAPKKSGAYRILVYVTDDQNNAGTANIPFFVKD